MLKLSNNPAVDTATKLVVVAVAMFAFVFVVMVPLYNVLCDALGINGKTSSKAYTSVEARVDENRTVTIQFVATNNAGMPWEFGPTTTMVAQAIPSVSPARAAEYFHKTECFCFNQQPLEGGSSAEMPLQFIVDQDLPRDIRTITLSYTIFDVTDTVDGTVAAR